MVMVVLTVSDPSRSAETGGKHECEGEREKERSRGLRVVVIVSIDLGNSGTWVSQSETHLDDQSSRN